MSQHCRCNKYMLSIFYLREWNMPINWRIIKAPQRSTKGTCNCKLIRGNILLKAFWEGRLITLKCWSNSENDERYGPEIRIRLTQCWPLRYMAREVQKGVGGEHRNRGIAELFCSHYYLDTLLNYHTLLRKSVKILYIRILHYTPKLLKVLFCTD